MLMKMEFAMKMSNNIVDGYTNIDESRIAILIYMAQISCDLLLKL